ncbi:ATPase [Colletotrichum sojae]|uniref:ATPase n=1 Tax=Colletotrichum sojae TaxID=2175907 RepID=A0A8H6JY95_9PEZI|nr:ATPase [Colletotrichum sojae]
MNSRGKNTDFDTALSPAYNPAGEKIEQSCRIANIHQTVAVLLHGYDAEGLSQGAQISGQRERVATTRSWCGSRACWLRKRCSLAAGTATAKGQHEEVIGTSGSYRLNAMQQMLGHRRHSGSSFSKHMGPGLFNLPVPDASPMNSLCIMPDSPKDEVFLGLRRMGQTSSLTFGQGLDSAGGEASDGRFAYASGRS